MKTRRFVPPLLATSALLVFILHFGKELRAQASYHVFTDKKGQAIEATPLSISPDKTKLQIRRKDGVEFEISILTLNLDDQQFIKNWMGKNPVKMDYKVDITFEKNFERTKYIPGPKNRYDLKFVTEKTSFDMKVKNMTRATLSGLILEHYIITEHSVYTGPYDDPDEKEATEWYYPFDYWSRKGGKVPAIPVEKPISLSYKKISLKDLPYSFSAEITTDTIPIREITKALSRESMNKDTLIGIIVRLTDADGNEISVQRSSDHDFLKKSWDEISQLPPGDPSGRATR